MIRGSAESSGSCIALKLSMNKYNESFFLGLGMANAILYATAKREGVKLVTSDKHFKGFEDVGFLEE